MSLSRPPPVDERHFIKYVEGKLHCVKYRHFQDNSASISDNFESNGFEFIENAHKLALKVLTDNGYVSLDEAIAIGLVASSFDPELHIETQDYMPVIPSPETKVSDKVPTTVWGLLPVVFAIIFGIVFYLKYVH